MGWRSVIITQHAKLSYTCNLMIVQTNDGISQIPIDDIQLLMISTTQAVITTALLSKLSEKNVKVIFTDKYNEPCCETVNYYPNNRSTRLLKKQFLWEKDRKEILWTKIIHSKIYNQIQVLNIYHHNTEKLKTELDKLEMNDNSNREAIVARRYFPLLFTDKRFTRRSTTVINAALNYGYAILLSLTNREIVEKGYLTNLGIHHRNEGNQFNLGSDLMEPFRPVVDYWVANQNFHEFTPDVKFGLIDAMNLELKYCGNNMILRNALSKYVDDCLKFLDGTKKSIKINMELKNEVPNNALISHV